ncbi:hypothetical protein EV640_101153 [Nesterenkonia aurantiaca]|uniref:Uncharacterized protein n=1 Tax=Nesterenkonia aurantiaca TaxID=1436010 RepID=A0A4R7G7C6_9MICC|nr:hypothetical protein EV640_101153 [Nesterenkonia aurantiaca]
MLLVKSSTIVGLNPVINSSWIDIAWWGIPIAYATALLWAAVELVRNQSLDLAPKIAFAFLMVLAPFIGSVLTILLVRTHARPSARGQTEGTAPTEDPTLARVTQDRGTRTARPVRTDR